MGNLTMTTLLFLDDYHVGDPLFLADLGRRLSRLGSEGRTLIVHRASEEVGRNLEGAHPAERDEITERTIRHTNQGITRRLIEEGVPAVSVQGSDRPLFCADDSLTVGSTEWLVGMVELGSVAVISPLAESESGAKSIDPVDAAIQIARVMAVRGEIQCAIFCSTRKDGLRHDGKRLDTITVAELAEHDETIDREAASRLAGVVDRLVATNSVAIAKGPILPGTVITA